MLEIRNVTKVYETAGFKQKALDDVSVSFREHEFASILGPSGSGKTTFLNIIGGLDHYDSGDLIINEVSTKKYKDKDWDSYRNHRIGFVFQSYNLISHQSILNNVILALTLSGISKKESIQKAKDALKEVGLEDHMYKKPNQLSGGQMQRVAIARALVNNPDILLADEPTGALDSKTSVQIMDLLKKISKDKLVIMVTHNPELAEKYSSRIINLKDGKIVSDTNPYDGKKNTYDEDLIKEKRTKMSFLTALGLSFNNLMTKKGRTILVSIAGSIGIIGIALILSLSNGFQKYVDTIQEDTLTSYPLTIMQESTDLASMLVSMRDLKNSSKEDGYVTENPVLNSMFSNFTSNDLKSYNNYFINNYPNIKKDISTIKYGYSITPLIYTIDVANNLAKLNPSSIFTAMYGNNPFMSSFAGTSSLYSQMIDNIDALKEQYDVVAGTWPEKYNELIIVLNDEKTISDLLVYSLGLRDTTKLPKMINGIMNGEEVEVDTEPLKFTYEDLLNVKLKLIPSVDIYQYNNKYKIYEDMSKDEKYMKDLYNKSVDLKIVGIVTPKEGTNSMALTPGVAYTSKLIDYLLDYASKSDIVKKQIDNPDVNAFSGKRFDSKTSTPKMSFNDLISIDTKKIQEVLNVSIDTDDVRNIVNNYINEISSDINSGSSTAKTDFNNGLIQLENDMFNNISGTFTNSDIDNLVNNYLNTTSANNIINNIKNKYNLSDDSLKNAYSGLLKSFLQIYIPTYYASDQSLGNMTAKVDNNIKNQVMNTFNNNSAIKGVSDAMANIMSASSSRDTILSKLNNLSDVITKELAKQYNVSAKKLSSAIKMKYNQEQMARIFSAMMSQTETSYKANLLTMGYQDKEEPTSISYYFNSFEGKENFIKFIDNYNDLMEEEDEEKVIHYSDTTGILMDSVKTIVNAVSYVLIAFVSISLVVSSFMIGIITYISVYERTKEIGILRAIGASKHNISSIFNAETFIIGLLSGLFGIGISYSLIPIINLVLHHFAEDVPIRAYLSLNNSLILVALSIILTLIGGLIPARAASKKDPVEALRTE